MAQLRDSLLKIENIKLELENTLEKLDFNPENTKTELIREFLGIALNDTYVTTLADFLECVAMKKSDNDSIDLAIIQLKDKTTPNSVKTIFPLKSQKNIEPLKLNDNVYMIGFNYGISLANTSSGIKSQFTQGTITQEPDQNKILYSIPTLPGSSGSPVLDKWGNLFAINFGKILEYQGFSFGIPSIALADLYYNHTTEFDQEYLNLTSKELGLDLTVPETLRFSSEIRGFLKAEGDRDFNTIYSYFSPQIRRYYDIINPDFSGLKSIYEKLWGYSIYSRNDIKAIEEINDSTYNVQINYRYFDKKKLVELNEKSTIQFLFDSNGKIIEIFKND
jgi:hypothetical protein